MRSHVDEAGRSFDFVLLRHDDASRLVVHFSAFFGEWGERKEYRRIYRGYFHRLRMFGDVSRYNWLFLCDQYGADGNGTYYTGKGGDLFVERATLSIMQEVMSELEVGPTDVVTMGSSMGATAALKFGLMLDVCGIVAVAPHIDLDICAVTQGRFRHVSYICPDGDPTADHNHPLTRQVRRLVEGLPAGAAPPRLYLQCSADDMGVYPDQVLPLVNSWREHDGVPVVDVRPRGGHTSDFATKSLLLDVVDALFDHKTIHVESLQQRRRYRPQRTRAWADLSRRAGRFVRSRWRR